MSDCRFGVSPVNYPDPDPDLYLTFNSSRRLLSGCSVIVTSSISYFRISTSICISSKCRRDSNRRWYVPVSTGVSRIKLYKNKYAILFVYFFYSKTASNQCWYVEMVILLCLKTLYCILSHILDNIWCDNPKSACYEMFPALWLSACLEKQVIWMKRGIMPGCDICAQRWTWCQSNSTVWDYAPLMAEFLCSGMNLKSDKFLWK